MSWIAASLASAALFSAVGVLDKRILAERGLPIWGFYLLVGLLQVAMAGIAALAFAWQGGTVGSIAAASAAGAFAGASLLALFYGIRTLEISRATPIFHTFPVFVALMAVMFLGEHLSALHWLAIVLVVVGAAFATIGESEEKGTGKRSLAYAAVVIASLLMAASTVATKGALEEMSFWDVFAIRSAFLGSVLLIPALSPRRYPLAILIFMNRKATLLTVVSEGLIAASAMSAMLIALSLAPASIATALMSTRPIFVLFLSALLSTRRWKILDEPLGRKNWAAKSVATISVVVGVVMLTML